MELTKWISAKAKTHHSWTVFADNPQVLAIAHKNATLRDPKIPHSRPQKIVDITDFKALLVHLFATSLLWTHFYNADNWAPGDDVGNNQLNFEEFKLGVQTLCKAHASEVLSEEQLRRDFEELDTNLSDSIGFNEVMIDSFPCP